MIQLRGLRRFGSICESSLVVSAMAKIIDQPLRWSRVAKKAIVKINDVGPLKPGRVMTSTNGACAISIRLNSLVSSVM